MAKKVFLFIVFIRALAALVITNSHYTGVYPTDLIANGGLLGDVLFFAVSGFCLANTQGRFGRWYVKRLVRVYTPTWIITIVYMLLGAYAVSGWKDLLGFFAWPTHWHFIASIILLYIPLFGVSKYIEMNNRNYGIIAGGLLVLQIILYFSIYDKSYYHIDTVREPMIEFLFFQSMLLGLHYRWKSNQREDNYATLRRIEIVMCILLVCLYFASKLLFVKVPSVAPFQIFNQIALWGLLYILFDIFMKFEPKFINIGETKLWTCVKFISDRTLEIYLVQYVILGYCKIGPFPLNWLLLTTLILSSAVLLHWISQKVISHIKL